MAKEPVQIVNNFKLKKYFMKGLLLILLIFISTNILVAQSQLTPTKIDVSEYFERINEYNSHIKKANQCHYTLSKRFNTKLGTLAVGLGGGLYTYNQVKKTGDDLWYVGVGFFAGAIIGILRPADETVKELEEFNLSVAKEILEDLKARK